MNPAAGPGSGGIPSGTSRIESRPAPGGLAQGSGGGQLHPRTARRQAFQHKARTYRPDIDGLRAIAVLAVIAFHANPRLVPGGFAGVDVFFVISGYLITGLIFDAMTGGTFRFLHFYARRVRRILPAYIVVSLATLAASTYLLIPNDYIFYTTSLATSWAFVSNVFFSMLSWGYFGQRSEEFPLLHTWSLAIEEQFYFIFPVLLFGLVRYGRGALIPALVFLTLLFTLLSEFSTDTLKSYFLLTSRAHELLIGALAFFAVARLRMPPDGLRSPLALLGLTMVIGSFVLLDKDKPFPGLNSLFPCLGTALLIYACAARSGVTTLLGSRPLAGIGLISYSLYLWHWPIFAFLKYRQIPLSWPVITAALGFSTLLAFLTWKLIENPARRVELRLRDTFLRLYALPAAVFMTVGLHSYFTEGIPQRFSTDLRELISSYSFERDLTRSCSVRAEDYKKITLDYLLQNCSFGDLSHMDADVLLMGDSHAHHFKPFVEQLARDAGLRAIYHVQGGCFPTVPDEGRHDMSKVEQTCRERNANLLALASRVKYVVLAGYWSSLPDRNMEKELRTAVDRIIKAGAVPVIFKDNPSYEPDLSRCILYKRRGWLEPEQNCNIPSDAAIGRQAKYDSAIDKVRRDYPQSLAIDPKPVMCDDRECATYVSNIAFYKDSNHLNTRAAQLLGERYITAFGNPLRKSAMNVGANANVK